MKLTKAESKWLEDLKALLASCPSKRLGFYTIGDPGISVYDYTKEKEISALMDRQGNLYYPGAVDSLDAEITFLNFPNCVHSVSG